MKRGTQIAYIPPHADGDINHQDVEFGFVTSLQGNAAFCRYWYKGKPGELRTKASSEWTSLEAMVEHDSVTQEYVDDLLEIL